MNDSVTMIFYTVNGKTESDYHAAPKQTRQTFYYRDGVLIQSRLYPDTLNEEQRTMYRQIVQDSIAKSMDTPNLWKLRKEQNEVDRWVDTVSGSTHYRDYGYDEYRATVSLSSNPCGAVVIGSRPLCFICGEEHTYNDGFECSECPQSEDEVTEYCWLCECALDMDDSDNYHSIGYHYYCNDCVDVCDDCGASVTNTHTAYTSCGDSILICERCKDDNYAYCRRCDELYHHEYIIGNGGDDYCTDCYDKTFFTCDECDREFLAAEKYEDDEGRNYCTACCAMLCVMAGVSEEGDNYDF
jgi:hypothetical protein